MGMEDGCEEVELAAEVTVVAEEAEEDWKWEGDGDGEAGFDCKGDGLVSEPRADCVASDTCTTNDEDDDTVAAAAADDGDDDGKDDGGSEYEGEFGW